MLGLFLPSGLPVFGKRTRVLARSHRSGAEKLEDDPNPIMPDRSYIDIVSRAIAAGVALDCSREARHATVLRVLPSLRNVPH